MDKEALARGLFGRSAPMTLAELVAANQKRNPVVPLDNTEALDGHAKALAAMMGASPSPSASTQEGNPSFLNALSSMLAAPPAAAQNAPVPVAAPSPAVRPVVSASANPMRAKIVAAHRSVNAQRKAHPSEQVKLSHLRAAMPGEDWNAVTAELLKMRKDGAANLANLDNPRDIQEVVAGGAEIAHGPRQKFHIVSID